MPNFDGGHYFLTAMIPVRTELVADPRTSGRVTSHTHALREVLAQMPTALQSPATEAIGINSPFARNARTHLARFVVVDDVAFQGKAQRDPLAARVSGENPLTPDHVDALPHAYLLFVADFDAPDGKNVTRDAWCEELWGQMEPELRAILQHCEGSEMLEGEDGPAAGFAELIRACQIETTMPFNDYWEGAPPLKSLWLPLAPAAGFAAAFVLAVLFGLVAWMIGEPVGFWAGAGVFCVAGVAGCLYYSYSKVMLHGAQPFPAAPRSDLPSVLKALYLQQKFARLLIETQGKDAATVHAAFGAFLAAHRPDNTAEPTQPRGVVRS